MNTCYSCLDQVHFQLHGQTDRYWLHIAEQGKRFIAEYVDLGRPRIGCELCGRIVSYTHGEDGKWYEEADEEDDE